MAVVVKVEGLREVEAALRELPKSTGKNVLRRVLMKRGKVIADHARMLAREDEGDLKKSLKAGPKLSRRQAAQHRSTETKHSAEIFVGAGALVQAITEEFGTENQAPHPFLRPAWDSGRNALLEGIKDDLWAEIKVAAERRARKLSKQGAAAVAKALATD